MDFYSAYATWFTKHYNRPFTVTQDEWAEWCKATGEPKRSRCSCQVDHEFDVETERREGWGYDLR